MSDPARATALVPTDRPDRYAKQLASHLSRRSEIHEEPDGTRVVLTRGECLLRPEDDGLRLEAEAPDDKSLDIVTDVIGRHLERFGQRNELQVEWSRD